MHYSFNWQVVQHNDGPDTVTIVARTIAVSSAIDTNNAEPTESSITPTQFAKLAHAKFACLIDGRSRSSRIHARRVAVHKFASERDQHHEQWQ